MVFDSEKEVNSLVKHELGNILQLSEAVLSTDGYRDEYIEKTGYKAAMEEFTGVLDAAVTRLGASYDLCLAEQDIGYISDFDPSEFHDDFSQKVEKAKNLAEVAESYIEETENEHSGWIDINDIFRSYGGVVDSAGYENIELRGDSSLNCVLSTLEDNSNRHGGEDVTPHIKVDEQSRDKGEYVLEHWENNQNKEYVDHWYQESPSNSYMLLFWDDGEGLDEEYEDDPEKIFAKGEGDNSGMGLHLSRRIIESFDGEMNVLESHPEIPGDAGMKIAITIPGKIKDRDSPFSVDL